jgi:hypothetical protein
MAPMNERTSYLAAAGCLLLFLATQTFQEIVYRFWIPVSHSPQDDLLVYLLPVERTRAILLIVSITALIVPFVVIALRCFRVAPVASTCGLVFGAAFICFELSQRGVDFSMVGQTWAVQFAQTNSGAEREAILRRFELWNEIVRGWYFPLLLTYLLSSLSFAIATWKDSAANRWLRLAPAAFVVNAARLIGRLLSSYAGQEWLNGFNGSLYFPTVVTDGILLAAWFFFLAGNVSTSAGDSQLPGRNTA